jgi:enamine deaminase RidA (YjgF/YER057c/UK114 family)
MIERFNSNGLFHEAVRYGDMLYLSGQVGAGATVAEQTRNIFEKLEKILEKYGSDKEHVISATVYLADMATFGEFNGEWKNFFTEGIQPVRTALGAPLARPDFLVEITLIAAVK